MFKTITILFVLLILLAPFQPLYAPALDEPVSNVPDILKRIAQCESGNKQYDNHGRVIRGRVNRYDVGKYQINELYWLSRAIELGFNIYTEEGNEQMALYLYEKYGTKPWKWSKNCWQRAI